MRELLKAGGRAAVFAAVALSSVPAWAQQVADPGFKSVGRGAPLVADLRKFEMVGAMLQGPFGAPAETKTFVGLARDGAVPPGIKALPVDLFADGEQFREYFKANYGPTIAAYGPMRRPASPSAIAACPSSISRRPDGSRCSRRTAVSS